MERALEVFAAVHFTVVGLSHILQHRVWAEFFIWLRGKGHAGVFVHGFLSLGFGSMILAFHNIWSGLPTVLTLVGVLYLLKALQCFLVPTVSMRLLQRVSPDRSWEFILPGVVFVALAGMLCYSLWRTSTEGGGG
jgi:hypothetical protein